MTVAGAAVLVLQDDPASVPAATPSPTAAPVRPDLLPALDESAPLPTPAGLQDALRGGLADPALRGGVVISVVDTASGEALWERAADVPLLPASTAKIVTAIAALSALPPEQRLTTRVVAGAAPGEVVLVGGGDPTLAGPGAAASYPAPARLTDLATRARAALGSNPVTRVLVDDTLYSGPRLGPGWTTGYLASGAVAPVGSLMVDGGRVRADRRARHDDPALVAGRALADLLQPGAPVDVARGVAPAGAAELGVVSSPPVPLLVEAMLARSDNDLAEALARQVALAQGQPASFAGAAAAVGEALAPLLDEAGLAPNAVALLDGSGLSRQNRLHPAALTRLLAAVAVDDGSSTAERLSPVLTGLPVAGFSGTLDDRYRGSGGLPGAGVVRAKTGTLDGVSALAGLVRTADGRLLAFDLTAQGVPFGAATLQAEAALDRLAAALAACGCR